MSATLWPRLAGVLAPLDSTVSMTLAWSGHLKHRGVAGVGLVFIGR